MAQSIQELQRGAILRMLNIGDPSEQSWGGAQTWKVLVYDKFCQEVVAPLLKVGGLRNHGVTLHLNLSTERQPVPDVPAVYFVEPTVENIAMIAKDFEKRLYESCYINFASAVPRPLLEELARGAMQAGAGQRVAGVFDRYVSFVSLSPSLFSLNLPAAYETIHSPSIADHIIQQYIERIVDGLLSMLVTMRSLPIIRCPPNEVAEMVGRRLEERIRELLSKGGSAAAELFTSTGAGAKGLDVAAGGPGAMSQRPVLCILDRDVDLVTMLNHTWTYQAMAHDVLSMKLNRLTVPVESSGDASAPPKPVSYSVDESDTFWVTHAGEPFPAVAEAVHEAIEEFNRKRADMSKSGESDDPSQTLAPDLAAAINALPEMTEKKRSIDMHTNIATALMNEVKARELHHYYEMEDQFSSQSVSKSVSELEELLNDRQRGTILDKTRALMVLYLTKPSMTPSQLQGLIDALEASNGDALGIAYLRHLLGIRNMMVPSLVAGPGASGASDSAGASLMGSAFGGLADRMLATGEGLLAAGMSNIKNIVASKKELVICQILDAVMEQKATGITENYIYLDPKAPPATGGVEAPRIRAPFRRAIAFVVGGGNYTEMQSVQEWAQAHGRQVTYGSTDLVSPAMFVEELCHLGQAQCGGGGSADLR
mmetsp:Transcript_128581/g.274239  ORF Transcript_128581/g.274239 Transcript_128581/m.274239 type:complete len:653 (-) Transcript_128581:42-2000(-)